LQRSAHVVYYRCMWHLKKGNRPPERFGGFSYTIHEIHGNAPRSPNIPPEKIGKTAQTNIDAIVADATITRKGLADLLGKSEDTIKYHLMTLQARKIIVHIGHDNGGHWKVLFK